MATLSHHLCCFEFVLPVLEQATHDEFAKQKLPNMVQMELEHVGTPPCALCLEKDSHFCSHLSSCLGIGADASQIAVCVT